MIWGNDYDHGDGTDDTYSDYSCECGVTLTIPWKDYSEDPAD